MANENMIQVDVNDFNKLMADIKIIKNAVLNIQSILSYEGEVTEWAERELEEARKIPRSENISHKEAKQMVLKKSG